MAKAKSGEVKFVYVPSNIAPNFPQQYTTDPNTLYFIEETEGSSNLSKIYLGDVQFADASVTLDNVGTLIQTVVDDPQNAYSIVKVGSGNVIQDIVIDGRTINVILGDIQSGSSLDPVDLDGSDIELTIGGDNQSKVVSDLLSGENSKIIKQKSKIKIAKPEFTYNASTKSIEVSFGNGVTSSVSISASFDDYYTKSQVDSKINQINSDLSGFATKEYVQTNFATKDALDTQIRSLENRVEDNYLSKDDAPNIYLSINDAQDTYVQKTDLIRNYYSKLETYNKQEVDQKIASAAGGIDLSGYQRVIEKLGFAEEGKTSEQVICNGEAFVVTDGTTYHTIHTNLKIATDTEVVDMINDVFNS